MQITDNIIIVLSFNFRFHKLYKMFPHEILQVPKYLHSKFVYGKIENLFIWIEYLSLNVKLLYPILSHTQIKFVWVSKVTQINFLTPLLALNNIKAIIRNNFINLYWINQYSICNKT